MQLPLEKNKTSRYTVGGVTEVSPGFIEWWEKAAYQRDPSDLVYSMEKKYEGRPDHLAVLFYEDSKLWWIICQYNSILDPLSELVEGKILYIPALQRIRSYQKEKNVIPTTRTNG